MDDGGWKSGWWGGGQTGRQAAHQLCLSGVVCAGMGTWPKTTSASSSRAPSTHITAADLFELHAIVLWQMEALDRPPQWPDAHILYIHNRQYVYSKTNTRSGTRRGKLT